MAFKRDSRLTGINPLAYVGDNAFSPPNITTDTRSPTSNDKRNFIVGDLWLNRSTSPQEIWMLVSLQGGTATWIQVNGAVATATSYVCDTGTATPAANILNVIGSLGVETEGSGNTVELFLSGFTENTHIVGGGTSGLKQVGVPINGQLLIGSTGATPVISTITQGTGITVTNGAGSIEIAATGGSGSGVCSFQAFSTTPYSAALGNPRYVGDEQVLTENFDVGGDFFPGDGLGTGNYAVFTAPQDGKYLICFGMCIPAGGSSLNPFSIITTKFTRSSTASGLAAAPAEDSQQDFCGVFEMDAADTAIFTFSSGSQILRIYVSGTLLA